MEEKIYNTLKKIESKELEISNVPDYIYSGNITYNISNGWKIIVFVDSGEWDYIDTVEMKNLIINFDELENMSSIYNYFPSDEVAKNIYKIPNPSRW